MARSQPSVAFAEASFHRLFDLASGGMGRVELVARVEGTFRRLYAVKRLLAGLTSDGDVRGAFLDEARLAGLVRHPNVVSVLDVGEDEQGPYLLMDYVEGVSVGAMLTRAVKRGEPVPQQVCIRTIMQAADGLHAAHQLVGEDGAPLRLVHRDVSPPNILVGFDGVVRVTDFGVAKALGRSNHTTGSVLKGKFGYMSPEQLRFEPIDHRSDLFALGVVFFEMLSAKRLYANKEDMEGTRRLLAEPPPDLADVRDDASPELVKLLFSMLAKKPEHRPSSALEVRRQLEEILAACVAEEGRIEIADYLAATMADKKSARADAIAAAMDGVERRPAKTAKPRWPYAVAIAAGAAVVALVGYASLRSEPASPPPDVTARVDEPSPPPDVTARVDEPSPPPDRTARVDEPSPPPDGTARVDEPSPPPDGTAQVAQDEPPSPPPREEATLDSPTTIAPKPPKRRAPTTKRRKKSKTKKSGGVPMWEWE